MNKQTKMFYAERVGPLEREVNEFLKDKPHDQVLDIQFRHAMNGTGSWFSCMVVYSA